MMVLCQLENNFFKNGFPSYVSAEVFNVDY